MRSWGARQGQTSSGIATSAVSGVSAHDEPSAVGCDRCAAAVGHDGFGHVVELYGDDRLAVACHQDGASVGRPHGEVAGRDVDVVAAVEVEDLDERLVVSQCDVGDGLAVGRPLGPGEVPSASSSASPVRTSVHQMSPKRSPSVRVRMNTILSCSGDQLWPRTSPKPWVSGRACSVVRSSSHRSYSGNGMRVGAPRSLANAIRVPSGDHRGKTSTAPSSVRRRRPVPSSATR